MNLRTFFQKVGKKLVLALTILVVGLLPAASLSRVMAASPSDSSLVCTSNSSSTFTLTTKTGTISIPDGNTIFMWGFSEGDSPFQYPGPILCVNQGETVTIVLNNTLPQDVSIIFPGQENVLANGIPSQPVLDLSNPMDPILLSMAPVALANGGSMTYTFVASEPGTFQYESGTNPAVQVQMGLFGLLVVRPSMNTATETYAYNKTDTQYKPGSEFAMILSEIDPVVHTAVEQGLTPDLNTYLPRYFMINGRSFPDTVAPNFAAWLPAQPYSSLVHISVNDASNPLPALVRYAGFGRTLLPFHPHGNNVRIIGRDGRPLGDELTDQSYDKFSIPVGPGQIWDTTFIWQDVEGYDEVTNPVPVPLPIDLNLVTGQYYSGSPYLGSNDPLPPGTITFNQCGEYYHVAHNHALQQITAWGLTMSGQLTFTRIDPPQPNNCP